MKHIENRMRLCGQPGRGAGERERSGVYLKSAHGLTGESLTTTSFKLFFCPLTQSHLVNPGRQVNESTQESTGGGA